MSRKEIPEISTGAMADIAFLLLIFFLVTTTMNVDQGLIRVLPPQQPPNAVPPDYHKRNVLVVLVNRNDEIMVQGEPVQLQAIQQIARRFLLNPNNLENLAEKKMKEVPLIGTCEVTKGIISLQTDLGTSYQTFVQVLNELEAAGNELKDETSLKYFHTKYKNLSAEQKKAVNEASPVVISEADPNRGSQ